MIGSWSAPPSSEPTSASSRRRSRSYATRTAARSPPRRGDAVSSSSPTGSKLRARVERTAGSGWSSRASAWSSGRRSSASDVWRRAVASSVSAISRNCAGSRRPPRAARSTAGPMSCDPPIPTPPRSASRARVWSVSSRPRATITGSDDGSSADASRSEGGNEVAAASRSRTSGNSSSAIERASIVAVRVGSGGRDAARRPRRSPGRRTATGPRSTASPRTRSRPAVSATTSGRGSPAGAASTRSGDAGSEQVEPGHRAVDREPGRDEPGPAGERRVRRRPEPRRLARLRGSVRHPCAAPATTRAARRGSRRRPRAARRRGRGSPRAVPRPP